MLASQGLQLSKLSSKDLLLAYIVMKVDKKSNIKYFYITSKQQIAEYIGDTGILSIKFYITSKRTSVSLNFGYGILSIKFYITSKQCPRCIH